MENEFNFLAEYIRMFEFSTAKMGPSGALKKGQKSPFQYMQILLNTIMTLKYGFFCAF